MYAPLAPRAQEMPAHAAKPASVAMSRNRFSLASIVQSSEQNPIVYHAPTSGLDLVCLFWVRLGPGRLAGRRPASPRLRTQIGRARSSQKCQSRTLILESEERDMRLAM